jgi:hypothetical protein
MIVEINNFRPTTDTLHTPTYYNVIGDNVYMHGLVWGQRRSVLLNGIKYRVKNVADDAFSGPFIRPVLHFDGATNYGFVPYERSQKCPTDLTIMAWVCPETTGAQTLISSGVFGDTDNKWSVQLGAANELQFQWCDGAASDTVVSGLFVPLNTWSFICIRRREVNPLDITHASVNFWIDSTTVQVAGERGAMITPSALDADIYFGRDSIAITGYFSGYMCYPQILDYGASDAIITSARVDYSHANWGLIRYDMVDGTGTTLPDLDINPEVWIEN